MTNPPTVAPVEGYYALLRNGMVVGPLYQPPFKKYPIGMTVSFVSIHWDEKGKPELRYDDYDIIATISPADMQAVASGELERLRAALHKAEIEREYWRGCAVLAKDHVVELQKQLQDWISEGELRQGDAP